MKKQNIQDERVVTQNRKIKSEAFSIIMIVLFVSILIQRFFLDTPFEQYAVEVICFFGMLVYTTARYIMLRLDIYSEEKRVKYFPLISGIVVGILVTAINGICNYTQHANTYKGDVISGFIAMLVVTFICVTVVTFVVLSCLDHINKKKQVKIQKVLDEEEQDECK